MNKLSPTYLQLETNHRLVDRHVQHNRFWQKAIAKNRERFDRQTRLYDTMRELHSIRFQLKTTLLPDEAATLRAQEQRLTAYINHNRKLFTPVPFLEVGHAQAHLWTIRVPLYTDIQNEGFVRICKQTIETA